MKKIKSNDRMPARSRANVEHLLEQIATWRSPHRKKSWDFAWQVGPANLFEMLHSMRRWYSGQTMVRKVASYRPVLQSVMALDPRSAVGCYRGFKVPKSSPLANLERGDTFTLPVSLNHGFSSWTLREDAAHKFSGKSRTHVGLVVRLLDARGATPILAPTERTAPWFNALYALVIGTSFRPKEAEYVIGGKRLRVQVVRVKR